MEFAREVVGDVVLFPRESFGVMHDVVVEKEQERRGAVGVASENDDFRIQAVVEVLSPWLRNTSNGVGAGPKRSSMARPAYDARNSSVLSDTRPMRSGGRR
jgi:hypothetical protein